MLLTDEGATENLIAVKITLFMGYVQRNSIQFGAATQFLIIRYLFLLLIMP